MDENKLADQIKQFQDLAKENPGVDVTKLVMNAFETNASPQNYLTKRQKYWAYTISAGAPPFGLLFALKFYTGGKTDGKTAAWICVALTVFSVVVGFVMFQSFLSSSGTSLDQLQNLKVQDYQQVLQ